METGGAISRRNENRTKGPKKHKLPEITWCVKKSRPLARFTPTPRTTRTAAPPPRLGTQGEGERWMASTGLGRTRGENGGGLSLRRGNKPPALAGTNSSGPVWQARDGPQILLQFAQARHLTLEA